VSTGVPRTFNTSLAGRVFLGIGRGSVSLPGGVPFILFKPICFFIPFLPVGKTGPSLDPTGKGLPAGFPHLASLAFPCVFSFCQFSSPDGEQGPLRPVPSSRGGSYSLL